MRCPPQASVFKHLVPDWWRCWWKFWNFWDRDPGQQRWVPLGFGDYSLASLLCPLLLGSLRAEEVSLSHTSATWNVFMSFVAHRLILPETMSPSSFSLQWFWSSICHSEKECSWGLDPYCTATKAIPPFPV